MDTHYTWIDDSRRLAEELAGVESGQIALDLEADSLHSFREKTCLIQCTLGERHLIIDPLAGLDLSPLGAILEDPGVEKVFHGSDYDLRLLDRDFGFHVRSLFDTMVAARLAGETAFGLAALLDRYLGVELDKRHQRADWSKRPLPAAMLEYAVNDTAHLFRLARLLKERLAELGRTGWAAEEFTLLEAVRWSRQEDDGLGFLKVKGANRLDPAGLAVLRELFAFRDERARKKDIPRFRVLRDAVLLELAKERPATVEELDQLQSLPRPFTGGSGLGRALLHAVRKGCRAEPFQKPPQANRRGPRMETEQEERFQKFLEARNAVAAGLELDPPILGSRKMLTALWLRREEDQDWTTTEGLREWQRQLLAPLLS